MIWPLRYSAMLEHGKCASGSSSGFCGVNAMELDAIGLLQRLYFLRFVLLGPAGIANGLDIANLEDRTGPVWDGCPLHGDLVSQMLGEAFRREAIRLQSCDGC